MKKLIVILVSILVVFVGCKKDPHIQVEKIVKELEGTWKITSIHSITIDNQGNIIQDTIYSQPYEFRIVGPDENNDDPFNYMIFPLELWKYSYILIYLTPGFIITSWEGEASVYLEPDNYKKRILLWQINYMGESKHNTLNREIIDKNKEKWWTFHTFEGISDNQIKKNGYFEEWHVEKID